MLCRYKSAGSSSCQKFYNYQALAILLPVPKSRVINPVFRSSNNIGTPAHDFKFIGTKLLSILLCMSDLLIMYLYY